LLAIGWSLSAGSVAVIVALVGVVVLAGVLLRRRWPGGPTLVALAFLVESGWRATRTGPRWCSVLRCSPGSSWSARSIRLGCSERAGLLHFARMLCRSRPLCRQRWLPCSRPP
ncbi:MAG: hypothetical protein ACRDU4_06820, partial [Mycobacterium sp.]